MISINQRKLSLFLLLFISYLFSQKIIAQESNSNKYPEVGHIEAEISKISSSIFGGDLFETNYNLQIRGNIQNSPLSIGLNIGTFRPPYLKHVVVDCSFRDESGNLIPRFRNETNMKNTGGWLIGIVGEYDIARGQDFNPYFSATVGSCQGDDDKSKPFVRPTVGIEFLNFFRISYSIVQIMNGVRGSQIAVGIVFGGYPKK